MTATTSKPEEVRKWHALPEAEVLSALAADTSGLSPLEAQKRLEKYGKNALPTREVPGIVKIFFMQFVHPIIFILMAAGVASLVIGETVDAIFIAAVILLNSSLGAYQEWNAERSAASLQNLLKVRARVRRSGKEEEIAGEDLVPGDIVLLESGNKVAADVRLLQAKGLLTDESFLTGESLAAEKKTGIIAEEATVGDRSNMCFAGAPVLSGRGLGIVVETGLHTQVGTIAKNVSLAETVKPPLVMRMEQFTKHISFFILGVAALLSVILFIQGTPGSEIFFLVVALAVAAIPEGLPVALTVALSIATSRMSKRNVIVRKLTAVESLGSCTVIASDKTGTLTVNQQTVRVIEFPYGSGYKVTGQGYNGEGKLEAEGSPLSSHLENFIEFVTLANEGELRKDDNGKWENLGDAMDVALLALAYKAGTTPAAIRDKFPLIGSIPYESELKFSAAFYRRGQEKYCSAKGAVETILDFCDDMLGSSEGATVPLDRAAIEARVLELSADGYRVLAIAAGASGNVPDKEEYAPKDMPRLTLIGLAAFIDPLRPEVVEAVDTSHGAGIRVLMITGDHPATAAAIARELHILEEGEEVMTGDMLTEVAAKGEEALDTSVAQHTVFARVSPLQKLQIVESLRRKGDFVAVTGDGVNDAPAMRSANIGVAMGSGTDVAKETGSMIVTDDNFSSIVAGIEEGRFAYDNVRKVIYLLIATGAGLVMLFIMAVAANLPIPLLAVQLLWLNLVTNGIQDVALAFEGGEPGAMKRKPRSPDESVFNPQMVQQTVVAGVTMGLLSFGLWYYCIEIGEWEESYARNALFFLVVLLQNVHVFNSRSERTSAFRVPLRRNRILIAGVIGALGLHISATYIPFMQVLLRTEPLATEHFILLVGLALVLLVVMEIFKIFKAKSEGK